MGAKGAFKQDDEPLIPKKEPVPETEPEVKKGRAARALDKVRPTKKEEAPSMEGLTKQYKGYGDNFLKSVEVERMASWGSIEVAQAVRDSNLSGKMQKKILDGLAGKAILEPAERLELVKLVFNKMVYEPEGAIAVAAWDLVNEAFRKEGGSGYRILAGFVANGACPKEFITEVMQMNAVFLRYEMGIILNSELGERKAAEIERRMGNGENIETIMKELGAEDPALKEKLEDVRAALTSRNKKAYNVAINELNRLEPDLARTIDRRVNATQLLEGTELTEATIDKQIGTVLREDIKAVRSANLRAKAALEGIASAYPAEMLNGAWRMPFTNAHLETVKNFGEELVKAESKGETLVKMNSWAKKAFKWGTVPVWGIPYVGVKALKAHPWLLLLVALAAEEAIYWVPESTPIVGGVHKYGGGIQRGAKGIYGWASGETKREEKREEDERLAQDEAAKEAERKAEETANRDEEQKKMKEETALQETQGTLLLTRLESPGFTFGNGDVAVIQLDKLTKENQKFLIANPHVWAWINALLNRQFKDGRNGMAEPSNNSRVNEMIEDMVDKVSKYSKKNATLPDQITKCVAVEITKDAADNFVAEYTIRPDDEEVPPENTWQSISNAITKTTTKKVNASESVNALRNELETDRTKAAQERQKDDAQEFVKDLVTDLSLGWSINPDEQKKLANDIIQSLPIEEIMIDRIRIALYTRDRAAYNDALAMLKDQNLDLAKVIEDKVDKASNAIWKTDAVSLDQSDPTVDRIMSNLSWQTENPVIQKATEFAPAKTGATEKIFTEDEIRFMFGSMEQSDEKYDEVSKSAFWKLYKMGYVQGPTLTSLELADNMDKNGLCNLYYQLADKLSEMENISVMRNPFAEIYRAVLKDQREDVLDQLKSVYKYTPPAKPPEEIPKTDSKKKSAPSGGSKKKPKEDEGDMDLSF